MKGCDSDLKGERVTDLKGERYDLDPKDERVTDLKGERVTLT